MKVPIQTCNKAWLALLIVFLMPIETKAQENNYTIVVENVKHNRGKVRACFFKDKANYLGRGTFCADTLSQKGTVTLKVSSFLEGQYAVVIYHDENSNGRIDSGFMRIPVEPYAFPGNPSTIFGPPSFEKATVDVRKGKSLKVKF